MQIISKPTIFVLCLLVAGALAAHFYVSMKGASLRSQVVHSQLTEDDLKRQEAQYREKMAVYEVERKKKAEEALKAQEAAAATNNSNSFQERQKMQALAQSLVTSPSQSAVNDKPTDTPAHQNQIAPAQEVPSSYRAIGGESFRAIAQQIYGDRTNWQKIWRMNMKIANTENIPAGTVIRLPSRQVMNETEMAPPPVANDSPVAAAPASATTAVPSAPNENLTPPTSTVGHAPASTTEPLIANPETVAPATEAPAPTISEVPK